MSRPLPPVISRQQALARGITPSMIRHRLRTGRWQRIFAGVYATYSGEVAWRDRARAATLARGPGAVVSLHCALHLWGLHPSAPQILTLAEPEAVHRHGPLPGVRTRRRRRLTAAMRHQVPVTSLAQTVLDILALPATTVDDALALLTRAVSMRRITVPELREELLHHPRHSRRGVLEEMLVAAESGLGSVAEARYVRDVEQAHGLPPMERQVPMDGPQAVADGRSRRLDFMDRRRGLGLKIDGDLFHSTRQRQDRSRDREAAGKGEVTIRAGWVEVVVHPCDLAADVAAAQQARGWAGQPRSCGPDCRLPHDPRWRHLQPLAASG
ncbi:type IV toxin-antitoxin system AbiEi family antitoxin domain-containing protein [Ornithinimicrobium sufpigmenti]|uniref:type IV toxin-antitoxin system AbiEi family antitoxin domain-containing protein n=1 Tax=Ornithinimicrobium sufpigmenti TaxID=2508882 RepID=UPI0010363400|nr:MULTISPECIES: type IV toxin-antitoxin system AbiEi family antitoxin domain-containing protein [unclassified Ornithinimicrobium]